MRMVKSKLCWQVWAFLLWEWSSPNYVEKCEPFYYDNGQVQIMLTSVSLFTMTMVKCKLCWQVWAFLLWQWSSLNYVDKCEPFYYDNGQVHIMLTNVSLFTMSVLLLELVMGSVLIFVFMLMLFAHIYLVSCPIQSRKTSWRVKGL